MTDVQLPAVYNLYELSTGRRMFAQDRVRERAEARGLTEIVAHTGAAMEHDRGTRQLDLRWSARLQPAALDAAVQPTDVLVDRALSALRDGSLAQADVATPGDGLAEKVSAFLREVFPSGVGAVTSLPYVEELAAVDHIVEKLQGPLASTVTELGLTRQANRLAQLATEYRNALGAAKTNITFGQVRDARARGQVMLLETVALIIGHTRGGTPETEAARAELLAPILEQNEAVRRYLRARRRVEDVDPTTGEVDPNAPPSGPAPEAAAPAPAPEPQPA